jgi:hypothetical protein
MLPWFAIASLALVPPLFSRGGSARLAGPGGKALSAGMVIAIAVCLTVAGARGSRATSQVADLARIPISAHETVYSDFDLADRLLWAQPALRGRVAYDARIELLPAQTLHRMLVFNARASGWQSVAQGFTVLAFDPKAPAPIPAAPKGSRVTYRSPNIVLVRRTR